MSGVDSDSDKEMVKGWLEAEGFKGPVRIHNDAVTALARYSIRTKTYG